MKKLVFTLAACLGMAALSVAADDSGREESGKGKSDKEFLQKASQSGLAEVNLAHLATTRAQNQEVRRFAQQMVTDHTQMNQQLIQFANQMGVALPAQTDTKHQECYQKLLRLNGKKFDEEYMKAMVKDHEEAVSCFETEAKDAKHKELRTLAEKALPNLKKHLKMAKEVCEKCKGSSEEK